MGELRKLGIHVATSTMEKERPRIRKPPSPTWKAFLNNHVKDLIACDFFTVLTATFRVLFVCIMLAHEHRRIMHCNITEHPTAQWTTQQIVETFPWETAPRYLLRDCDGIYGEHFRRRIKNMDTEEVKIAPRSPGQNPYCERVISSIRRDTLDQVIVLNEPHLRRVLQMGHSERGVSRETRRTRFGALKRMPNSRVRRVSSLRCAMQASTKSRNSCSNLSKAGSSKAAK
jgi:hypothetical protein